jgi:IrrE N-terminal-like domain
LTLPSTPIAWANRLSAVLTATLGNDRFPVDVEQLAIEYTRQVFDDPVTRVVGQPIEDFEGALFPSPSGKPRWMIVYNSALTSEGRIRYTQAHEFGHYLLHRGPGQSIRCHARDMLIWDPVYERREAEANQFASYLLMPIDDYRRQVDDRTVDLNLFGFCADRYGVSLTAAILKWLEFTPKLAVLVVSCDGFIEWASSSKPALRKGAFFRTRNRPPLTVPEGTLAAHPGGYLNPDRMDHPCGVWFRDFAATEFAVISERYDMTLSLLLLRVDEARQWR